MAIRHSYRSPLEKSLDNYIAETTTNQNSMVKVFASGHCSMQQIAKYFGALFNDQP